MRMLNVFVLNTMFSSVKYMSGVIQNVELSGGSSTAFHVISITAFSVISSVAFNEATSAAFSVVISTVFSVVYSVV